MNNDTSNSGICKNVEYKAMYPWMIQNGFYTYTLVLNDKEKKQREQIRRLNMILSGEYDVPCQCPKCSTAR